MDLNQDIIPQICFSIRAGLAGRGEREGGRERGINQKIESSAV